jgi:hypothetical protein
VPNSATSGRLCSRCACSGPAALSWQERGAVVKWDVRRNTGYGELILFLDGGTSSAERRQRTAPAGRYRLTDRPSRHCRLGGP